MVVAEIVKWIRTAQRDVEIYFYRNRSGLEMDLLLETRSGIVGMEIKSTEIPGVADIRAMKAVAAALRNDWRGGIVVYRGKEIRKHSEPDI